MKNKKPQTYREIVQTSIAKKEDLPFHKMDDFSRRRFIQSVGAFLGILTVPSMIRLETMSKLSKKILGSSTAFAAAIDEIPIKIGFYFRAGYGYVPWLVGCASDDDEANNPADRNVGWGMNLVTSTNTTRLPLKLPPQSAGLTAYANSIQGIQCFASTGGHTENFMGTWMGGVGELLSFASKTQADAGLQTLLTQPFGYYNSNSFGIQNVPASLVQYSPSSNSSIANVYNQFTPPVLQTNLGTQLSASLQESIFSSFETKFAKDIKRALYDTNKDLFTASNKQAFTILATNYQTALNPNDASNSATMAALTAGLPAQTRMGSSGVNPAQAIFQIVTAANLGITPRVGVVGFDGTGDWHNDAAIPVSGNPGAGDDRTESSAFLAVLTKNLLDTVNSGAWENASSGQNEVVDVIFATEFCRTETSNMGGDDGDGSTIGTLIMSSDVNQNRFSPGSYGKVAANGQAMGFNPSNDTHSANISKFTTMQAFIHNAQLFGVDPSDFGISGSGIGGGMVDT